MINLVLGGARSGKSAFAERIAAASAEKVTYFATAVGDEADPDFAERIARHRDRRPASWETVEVAFGGNLVGELQGCDGAALVDSLGTWLAGFPDFALEHGSLTTTLLARRSEGHLTVLVSDEVGLGVHPSTEVGRQFRDALGDLNQSVAAIADEVWLAIAGRALRLPAEPSL
ncbi:MAG: bifunctional adenosylcobinamide kinase/adenosylcobinamide-phosphate guanylyltransferase [Acidimicrobiales bacterium]